MAYPSGPPTVASNPPWDRRMVVVPSITVSRIETPATPSDAGTVAQREATGRTNVKTASSRS